MAFRCFLKPSAHTGQRSTIANHLVQTSGNRLGAVVTVIPCAPVVTVPAMRTKERRIVFGSLRCSIAVHGHKAIQRSTL